MSYVTKGSRIAGFHGSEEGLPGGGGGGGGEDEADGPRDCASSISAKATLSAGIRGALDSEVAASTMPPFGSVEVPER